MGNNINVRKRFGKGNIYARIEFSIPDYMVKDLSNNLSGIMEFFFTALTKIMIELGLTNQYEEDAQATEEEESPAVEESETPITED